MRSIHKVREVRAPAQVGCARSKIKTLLSARRAPAQVVGVPSKIKTFTLCSVGIVPRGGLRRNSAPVVRNALPPPGIGGLRSHQALAVVQAGDNS